MGKTYRIKDIAALSGVSTGTVDRILHNRGKVSEEARQKVEAVLKEIDYHPNLIARSLALKKQYHLFTLIPSYQPGEYWELFMQGVDKAEQELFSYNINVTSLYFNQFDKSNFDKLTDELLAADCQGVVIATLFKQGVLELIASLDEKNIPYVLVDAYIENTRSIAYYGTNSYDSGYIAGRLLLEQITDGEDIATFRFIRKGEANATQVQIRETGFRAYLSEHNYSGKIHSVQLHADNQEENFRVLDAFFEANPDLHSGIIFSSRAYILGEYFNKRKSNSLFKLIGYDVIEKNVTYLENGLITHLIAQRPEVQGFNSLKALFRHLVLQEQVPPINYMPIDVLIKENIKYYNNYI
ncbi:LacI family transcriptional regulator [Parabacteroides sp. PFB2-10]|uniref:LacI family DNA-binding transcriptional regulator n=1 Tax=Parabacteroides sp. PFB2-10 TaxID=1742405 RepID=UPI002474EC41|nr:substrate-binding domain-containing protein [Parabacteroides sp. PFB2-10]MDH6313521.1 LacI family transcriptional regulator [Parabacteroides sp. PFB2-10]